MTTGADGSFGFTVQPQGPYTLTADKSNEDPVSQGVTTLDIALIRRHILAIANLDSPYRILAADVNDSSSVTTLDIALIRRVILAITDTFPGGLWTFVPSDFVFENSLNPWPFESVRSYSNLTSDALDQDFIGIKHGDVNGSWTAPSGASVSSSVVSEDSHLGLQSSLPEVTFRIGSGAGAQGYAVKSRMVRKSGIARPGFGHGSTESRPTEFFAGDLEVPVIVYGFDNGTTAQFSLNWDPAEYAYLGVGAFGVRGLDEGNFGTKFVGEGRLAFSWDDSEGTGVTLPDGSSLFVVSLRRVGSDEAGGRIGFADYPTAREVSLNAALARFQSQGLASEAGLADSRPSVALRAELSDGAVWLLVPTVSGGSYVIEFTDDVVLGDWNVLSKIRGEGSVMRVQDSAGRNGQRFYRVKME